MMYNGRHGNNGSGISFPMNIPAPCHHLNHFDNHRTTYACARDERNHEIDDDNDDMDIGYDAEDDLENELLEFIDPRERPPNPMARQLDSVEYSGYRSNSGTPRLCELPESKRHRSVGGWSEMEGKKVQRAVRRLKFEESPETKINPFQELMAQETFDHHRLPDSYSNSNVFSASGFHLVSPPESPNQYLYSYNGNVTSKIPPYYSGGPLPRIETPKTPQKPLTNTTPSTPNGYRGGQGGETPPTIFYSKPSNNNSNHINNTSSSQASFSRGGGGISPLRDVIGKLAI